MVGPEISKRIRLHKGDITKVDVDCIVNAANTSLLGGGGVDGAIHRAAGPGLLEECRSLGGCPTGQARITGGHNLPADSVIHAVGPVYHGKQEDAELLASAYRNSLDLAANNDCKSIAFPAVSCGVYGYPIEEAAGIAVTTVTGFLEKSELPRTVVFVLFSQSDYSVYEKVLNQ